MANPVERKIAVYVKTVREGAVKYTRSQYNVIERVNESGARSSYLEPVLGNQFKSPNEREEVYDDVVFYPTSDPYSWFGGLS